MKEILEKYFGKPVSSWRFHQDIQISQDRDKDIDNTEIEEPFYNVSFTDNTKGWVYFGDLFVFCCNNK
jgi:hypothetical protein